MPAKTKQPKDAEVARLDLMPDQRTPEIKEVLKPGPEATGYALAQSAIGAANSTTNQWADFAARLAMIEPAAREFFVKTLRTSLNQLRKEVEALKQGDAQEYEIARRAKASATTQISNLVTIAKALNAGYLLLVKTDEQGVELRNAQGNWMAEQPFYTILAECRMFIQSEAGGRGRPKTPWLDKLKKFILDNQPDFAGKLDESVALITEMARLTKHAQKKGEEAKKGE